MRSALYPIVLLALEVIPAPAKQATVTLLATTDVHGNLYPIDYFTDRPAARGLAKISTLIQGVRRETPNTLLVDCGDVIEGTPLESLWQKWVSTGGLPLGLQWPAPAPREDPMMAAMNHLGYTAMAVGNHEFNFGLKNLSEARAQARFPWLSANIQVEPGAAVRPFSPYVIRTVAGVKVAILGLTTPSIPTWEEPVHYRGYRFNDGVVAARAAVAEIREKEHPDVIVAAVHSGLGDPQEVAATPGEPPENMVRQLAAEVPGIDVIVFGHTHQQLAEERVGDALLVQPKNWGGSLARIDLTLDDSSGRWKLVRKDSRLVPVTASTEADPAILAIARPYHELTERYLNTPVAESTVDMNGRIARYEDTPLIDAIHAVQLSYAKADVSFASLFNTGVRIPKGPVTVRQLASLYIYDNELYAIEGDGQMIKDALENSARFFRTCPDADCSHGPLLNHGVLGFNFDMVEGVSYDTDLTKPEGERIVNLRRNGQPLDLHQKFRIALNNYRAGGSAGYTMFRNAKVLWKSGRDIRSLMIEYYSQQHALPGRASGNWHILPPHAVAVLENEKPEF